MSAQPSKRSLVIFRVGAEEYGVAVESVSGIIRYESPTPVPRAPQSVIGVVNLRGSVVPVVDLKHRFQGEHFDATPTSRIVVSDGKTGRLGIAVDAATEVVQIAEEDIRPVPEGILSPETFRAFTGVVERDGALVILLDIDEAVPHADFASVGDGSQEGELDV